MRPSAAQMVYIDGLYEKLGVPFTHRRRPQSMREACNLINDLKHDVDEMVDNAILSEEDE